MNAKYLAIGSLFVFTLLIPALGFAAPERLKIKSEGQKTREAAAKNLAQSVDLSKIEDPATRTALAAVFKALGLSAKKVR